MDQAIVELTSTATIAIALFGVVLSLAQTHPAKVRHRFALFLGVVAVNNMPDAFARLFEAAHSKALHAGEMLLWFPSTLMLAPTFWLYVRAVTATTDQPKARSWPHLLPAGVAAITGVLVLVTPNMVDAVMQDVLPDLSVWTIVLLALLTVLQLMILPQVITYLILIVRRLLHYRILLRDVYSTTEAHELRWIYVIGGLGAAFWLAAVLLQVLVFDPAQEEAMAVTLGVASIVGLVLVAATTLWGLRQRPPLLPDSHSDPDPQGPHPEAPHDKPPAEKYEKSALSPEAAARIARKLRAAMEQDKLHRDPNLSLWALARHVGASSNYISQTLSAEIGQSFFDFVNGYRINEAKALLADTDRTVLMITYDVGFNARSSFYNAFKKRTGQTPTVYRKNLSAPAGLDDRHI